MDWLFSCLLLASVLALTLALSIKEQREIPIVAMSLTAGSLTTTATSGSDSDCSLMFDYIGSFCQYVYRYQSGFSSDTVSTCMNIMLTCGSLRRDEAAEDICSSRLTSICADPIRNDFFMDYCGMVQVACTRGSDGAASASGDSGSAESEVFGSSSARRPFSGSDPDTFGTSGSGSGSGSSDTSGQPAASGTGSGKLASISMSSGQPSSSGLPESGRGSAELADISVSSGQRGSGSGLAGLEGDGGPGRPDDELYSPLPPYTTIAPNVLVNIKELSELQRENIVTVVFRGLTEEKFLESGIELFRRQVAIIVNTYLSKKGNNRQKRHRTPLTPEDVVIIEPLLEDQGSLQVAFLVGGEGGQSTPISRSELSSILEVGGQQLAADLSATTGLSVHFAGIIPTEPITTHTPPKITHLSPTGTVIIQSTLDNRRQEQQLLSAGAIAGAIIGVLLAVVLLSLLLITISAASYRALSRRKQDKIRSQAPSNKNVGVPFEDDDEFVNKWQPLAEGNNYQAVPVSDEMREGDLAINELS